MMRVLFVLNGNYPYSSTGTNLLNKLLIDGKLINRIDEVAVLGGKDHYDDLDEEKYNDINIYRAWSWTVLPKEDLWKVLKNNPIEFLKGIIQKMLFHLMLKFDKSDFIDKNASNAFYKVLKKIRAEKYNVIVSISGRYYQTDAVARFCKETRTKFVFYQVDPCGSIQYSLQENFQTRQNFERFVYEVASNVLTTDLIANDVRAYLSDYLCKKITLLEFPLISKPSNNHVPMKQNKKIYCLFTGSIYGGIRNPEYTIKLFKPIIECGIVELHFVGVNKKELNESSGVICHGVLQIDETMKVVQNADILINIGNSVTNQVPSKIFDYISTGKPIINICKSRECPTLKYLNKYPYALNLFEENEILLEQQQELQNFVKTAFGKKLDFNLIRELYEECTPEYCASLFVDVIQV